MHHIEYEGLVCPVVDQDIRKSVNDEIQILKPPRHAHPEIKLPMDPICRRREFQNIYAIWKQAKNKRVCPTAWFYCDADISIMGDLEDPRFLTFSAPGFIRGENAPKSSEKTLDDYFPMEVEK